MSFTSIDFVIFLSALFFLFYAIPQKLRLFLLVIASLGFISLLSPWFLIYSVFLTSLNYLIGKFVGQAPNGLARKWVYFSGQIINIGGLIFYKYVNFLFENITSLTSLNLPILDLLVPIGISYYTFQGISYLYLIYKANDKPESSYSAFCLYMLFFPKILAGPIERHRLFLPQLNQTFEFSRPMVTQGLRLVLWGMFKKVVIGDTLGLAVNRVYQFPEIYEGIPLLLVFFVQPLQIYADFSGYTDMAIGFSRMFGIQLSPNFNRPFFAKSVGEFWRRWHISLSSWCNDFIYNRLLLKNRKWGNRSALFAILVTFTIIGVWHGAKWTFLVVGLIQVAALIYEFYTKKWRSQLSKRLHPFVVDWGSRVIVYFFMSFFLVFFFSSDLDNAVIFFSNMFRGITLQYSSFGFEVITKFEFLFGVLAAAFVVCVDLYNELGRDSKKFFSNLNVGLRWSAYYIALVLIVYFSKNQTPFIYVQF